MTGKGDDMQENELISGFRVTRIRTVSEIGGTLVEMEHEKSGASLCWLDRPDPNKAFSIAFKTLPEDSTGTFHILEHSVLCGSDRYPVRDPFVELLKSSVQTFLNAITFPDKTVYPVSSRNDRDFLNLIDVYLDAVLHPAIYRRPEIFRQEGWRYEGEGEDLCYQGVVFNEMKGAFASPETVLENELDRLLFPDNCYRHVSGGDPKDIPDLTYEQFLSNHKKFYHPSNARISLVGSVDLPAVLGKIDSYLCAYDRRPASFPIPMQKPVASETRVVPYEIGEDEPEEERAIVACATLLGTFDDAERDFAASILAEYLTGDNDAPLKRAVIDRGLAHQFSVFIDDGRQQSTLCWKAMDTGRDRLPALKETVRETVSRIVNEGLDRDRLEACFRRYAFELRDREDGDAPRSLLEALDLLDTWLYDGDPMDGLVVEPALNAIEAKLHTDFFERLLSELFLENEHTATVVLVPSRTLGEKKREAEQARIWKESAAWTDADRKRLSAEAESLRKWQQTPDSEEGLASIPMLKVSDLADRPEPLHMRETQRNGMTVLRHALPGETMYFKAFFAANDLTADELPVLSVLCRLLGDLGTARHDRRALPLAIKKTIGRLDISPTVLPGSDPKHCRVMLTASVVCLPEQAEEAAALLGEILTETRWDDVDLVREKLRQISIGAKLALPAEGNRYGLMRVSSYYAAHGMANERIGGISFVQWLKQTIEANAYEDLLREMRDMATRLITRARLTFSCSEAMPDAAVDAFTGMLPPGGMPNAAEATYPLPGMRQEGVVIPAQIGFAVAGSNLFLHDKAYSGHFPVLANVLNYTYLWSEIRVQGGAYGCGFGARDSGNLFFFTYRDPQTARSLEVIQNAASFIRAFAAEKPDLTGAILSAVSVFDPLRSPEEKMTAAENRRFRGITDAEIVRRYRQLLETRPEDLVALCDALDDVARDRAICVVAGREQIDACDLLTSVIGI